MHSLAVIRAEARSTEPDYSRTPGAIRATRACRSRFALAARAGREPESCGVPLFHDDYPTLSDGE